VGKEVTRGTVVARGRQALASDLVVGLVGRDILADPLGVHTAPLGPYAVREDGHTEDVVETEGPVVDELGRADERVDQLFPLLRIAAGEKLTNATGRRKLAGEIETEAAQELAVARKRRWLNPVTAQLVEDEVVDEIEALRHGIAGDG